MKEISYQPYFKKKIDEEKDIFISEDEEEEKELMFLNNKRKRDKYEREEIKEGNILDKDTINTLIKEFN